MIDKKPFVINQLKNDLRTYENIQKIATGQGDDCTTGCLLDYNYFENYYKMIAIDLSKQQVLDADRESIHSNQFCCKSSLSWTKDNVFHY